MCPPPQVGPGHGPHHVVVVPAVEQVELALLVGDGGHAGADAAEALLDLVHRHLELAHLSKGTKYERDSLLLLARAVNGINSHMSKMKNGQDKFH